MDKIKRATEIHRTMTPHQMALYIVEIDEMCTRAAIRINELLGERNATGIAIDNAIRGVLPEHHPMLSRLQMLANMAKRITELQDALELAEEAVLAKQQDVPEGWQLVPMKPIEAMIDAADNTAACVYDTGCGSYLDNPEEVYRAMLAAAPKPEGGAA